MSTTATATAPASLPSSPIAPAPQQRTAADDLAAAITQLNRSERGRRAAVAFRKFLEADEGSASGLDCDNLRALEILAKSCRIFGAWNVRNVLPRR